MQKHRVYSLLTAICIAVSSIGIIPTKTKASQIFSTEQIIEAEYGALNGVIRENMKSASGSKSVYINTGAAAKSEEITLEAMSWLVNLPEKGTYRIFVRGKYTNDSYNDFWIGTNDDEWKKVSADTASMFKWREAMQIESEAGIKKIKIQPAERYGDFDAIYVTQNMSENFEPPIPVVEEPENEDEEESEADEFEHKQNGIF